MLVIRLGRFVLERFPLMSYGPLIIALVACGWAAASLASGRPVEAGRDAAVIALAVAAAFLQLRILDEIRDADVDRIGRPERPLPRGLVTVHELRAFAAGLVIVGVALAWSLGPAACAVYVLALLTVWLLGLDLARRPSVRHGALWHALMHSVIAPEMLLFVWAATAELSGSRALAATVVLVWGAGLAMEIGRKTVLPVEERRGVETYSAELGRRRALTLAALSFAVACLGAGALAVAVGGSSASAIVPFAAAATVPPLILRYGGRIATRTVRTASAALVLSVLLWPVVIMLATS